LLRPLTTRVKDPLPSDARSSWHWVLSWRLSLWQGQGHCTGLLGLENSSVWGGWPCEDHSHLDQGRWRCRLSQLESLTGLCGHGMTVQLVRLSHSASFSPVALDPKGGPLSLPPCTVHLKVSRLPGISPLPNWRICAALGMRSWECMLKATGIRAWASCLSRA
jgi:hypothetical protein